MKLHRTIAIGAAIASLGAAPPRTASTPLGPTNGVFDKWWQAIYLYTGGGALGYTGTKVKKAVAAQTGLAVIPFGNGLSIRTTASSVAIFSRQTGSGYASLQFEPATPYSLLSPMSELTQLFSGGPGNLVDAPVAPAGTTSASQPNALSQVSKNGSVAVAGFIGNAVGVSQSYGGSNSTFTIGPDLNSAFFADLNGDGNPDLVVAFDGSTSVPGGIAVLMGKDDGTFADPVVYASGTPATRFAVFDLNHDGALDIATVSLDQKVTILLGKGDGTFGSPMQYSLGTGSGGGSGQAIAIADFNGDGHPDIVAGGTAGILLGNGDGTFRAGPPLPAAASGNLIWAFAAGDLNGDGKTDLVYSDIENQVVVPMIGKGDGTFTPGQAYAVSQMPDSLVLTDYNGDGRLDIVNGSGDQRCFGSSDQSGNTDILINNGDGTFQGAPNYFSLPDSEAQPYGFTSLSGVAVANFGGGSPGAVTLGTGGLTLFPGDGKGGLKAPQSISVQSATAAMAAADFNGDGKPDVAVGQNTGNIAILPWTANGFGTPTTVSTGGIYPSAIASADFDGDGKPDLAVAGQAIGGSGGMLAILKGNGDGTFHTPVTMPAGVAPSYISAVDLNGDGRPDLVFADSGTNGSSGGIYVVLNTGGGSFKAPVQVSSGVFPAFGIADVNGDGKPDLVAADNTSEGALSWLPGNGDGTFQSPVAISTSDASISAILVKDFNSDGKADIVLAHQDSDTTFLAGNGDGTFSAETHFLTTAQPIFLQTADLNGDGKPDLIVGGFTISILLNKSVPSAKASVASSAPAISTSVAPGSLASAYGTDLASSNAGSAPLPLPPSFGGTSVSVQDASGDIAAAPLLYVSPAQVNFEVPPGVAPGAATLTVISGDGTQSVASIQVASVAPGIFELNSGGLAAAYVILYHTDRSQTVEQVYALNNGAIVAAPINLGSSTDQAYLFLFGTGLQLAGTSGVKVSVGGTSVQVTYAGPQGGYVGLDQVNALLPSSLAGKGNVTIQLTANGIAANPVNVTFQ